MSNSSLAIARVWLVVALPIKMWTRKGFTGNLTDIRTINDADISDKHVKSRTH